MLKISPGPVPQVTTPQTRKIELKAGGVLTEAEFQAQKAGILGS
jgi:hypothetical protein